MYVAKNITPTVDKKKTKKNSDAGMYALCLTSRSGGRGVAGELEASALQPELPPPCTQKKRFDFLIVRGEVQTPAGASTMRPAGA